MKFFGPTFALSAAGGSARRLRHCSTARRQASCTALSRPSVRSPGTTSSLPSTTTPSQARTTHWQTVWRASRWTSSASRSTTESMSATLAQRTSTMTTMSFTLMVVHAGSSLLATARSPTPHWTTLRRSAASSCGFTRTGCRQRRLCTVRTGHSGSGATIARASTASTSPPGVAAGRPLPRSPGTPPSLWTPSSISSACRWAGQP
mmetsp:Transcript_74106/g.239626  ORF Transcript_74106/g.239626 Transcript_74106/m.239626 type:complete len:205 (+) Transcript_74106:101-715(+)